MVAAHGAFEANPARLRESISELERIAAMASGMADTFKDGMAPYDGGSGGRPWYGEDDDYARAAGPQFEKNLKDVREVGEAIARAVASTVNARLAELKKIADTQGYATDSIDAARSAVEGMTSNAGGGSQDGRR